RPLLDGQPRGRGCAVERRDALARRQGRAAARLDQALGLRDEFFEIGVDAPLRFDPGTHVHRLRLGHEGRDGVPDSESEGTGSDETDHGAAHEASFRLELRGTPEHRRARNVPPGERAPLLAPFTAIRRPVVLLDPPSASTRAAKPARLASAPPALGLTTAPSGSRAGTIAERVGVRKACPTNIFALQWMIPSCPMPCEN